MRIMSTVVLSWQKSKNCILHKFKFLSSPHVQIKYLPHNKANH